MAAEPGITDLLRTWRGGDDRVRVVELRVFGGLGVEEIATALDISVDTVTRDWQFARSWLRRELERRP